MTVSPAADPAAWDAFLLSQAFRPFLQSWTMGEVYRDCGQEPVRLTAQDAHGALTGICMALVVPARRGKHLSVPYGPVVASPEALPPLLAALREEAARRGCTFLRVSPFMAAADLASWRVAVSQSGLTSLASPLHLLAEHLWLLPLTQEGPAGGRSAARTEEEILAGMRKTTRNLVRRAERDGVTVEASADPNADVDEFLRLHEETRKRHHFTPYTERFFRAQVRRFSAQGCCTVYLARHEGAVLATSIHMHFGGETSYHHGASRHTPVPVSYALQWKAITDALRRGDRVYNFWGIAPEGARRHPFAGVTLFKTGFGGGLHELLPCQDLPLSPAYRLTRAFETLRKWKRGF